MLYYKRQEGTTEKGNDMNAYDFKNAFNAYKRIERELDAIEEMEEIEDSEELENAWNVAYAAYHEAFMTLCSIAADIIGAYLPGFGIKEARAMIQKNESKIFDLVRRLA